MMEISVYGDTRVHDKFIAKWARSMRTKRLLDVTPRRSSGSLKVKWKFAHSSIIK